MAQLTPADRATLASWHSACDAAPGRLPPGVEPVQTRWIRSVGRGRLPHLGAVFVKVMGFPRAKDRLRYLLRALPAVHEARLLNRIAEFGVTCPEVVAVFARRRRGIPALSVLVTRALDVDTRTASTDERARIAARLADAGVFHPDLNVGNFVVTRDRGVAVLDLQSARIRRAPLHAAARVRMAAKLVADDPSEEWPDALAASGLVRRDEVANVLAGATAMQRDAVVGRVSRCLMQSTEFERRRTFRGVLHRRRSAREGGTWIHGDASLVHWWIGDRAREVLDGHPPVLGALFRKSWWLPGSHSVYIPDSSAAAEFTPISRGLQEGYRRFQRLRNGIDGPSE